MFNAKEMLKRIDETGINARYIIDYVRVLKTDEELIKAQGILWEYLKPFYKENTQAYFELTRKLYKIAKPYLKDELKDIKLKEIKLKEI